MPSDKCIWTLVEEFCDDHWTTSCGDIHPFEIDGKETAENMQYCCYCGKPMVKIVPQVNCDDCKFDGCEGCIQEDPDDFDCSLCAIADKMPEYT